MPFVMVVFALAVLAVSWTAGRWDLAVYALSFWHYLVYALAFFLRTIPLREFKRDAILLKTMSLVALAFVLSQTGLNVAALAVMVAGFWANIAAARVLGPDRTYYGVEVGGLPPSWSNAFPYSLLSHPMLIGNMVAYAGLVLDPEFRRSWWPLALLHVALNLLILVMEVRGAASRFHGVLWPCVGLVLGSLLFLISVTEVWHSAFVIVLVSLAFGAVLLHRYAKPKSTGHFGSN